MLAKISNQDTNEKTEFSEMYGDCTNLCRKMSTPGIPPNPLPMWTTMPLDAKLPIISGPKGTTVLYTTKLGEKIHKNSPELNFDLTDPNSMVMPNNYKPLHDPHLKPHLSTPIMRRRLYQGGFITSNGRVLCTLKEFNEYRQYLRKINLALARKTEEEKERLMKESLAGGKSTAHLSPSMRMRETKLREVRERISQQYEKDKARYKKLLQAEEERQRRMQSDQMARMTENEKKQQAQEEKRQIIQERRQIEEQRRQLSMLRRWIKEDTIRTIRTEAMNHLKDTRHQRKLEDNWELRKRMQQKDLDKESRRKRKSEELMKKRIADRERLVEKQRQRQQGAFMTILEQRRREREELESIYSQKFAATMEKQRVELAKRRKRKKGKGKPAARAPLKSNWDIEETLLKEFSDEERHLASLRLGSGEGPGMLPSYTLGEKETGSLTGIDALPAKKSKLPCGLELYEVLRSYTVQEEDDSGLDDIEKAAKAIVTMSLFITTKIIYPAYIRYLKEDHPETFIQYFDRPDSPVPPIDYDTTGFRGRSVRFLAAPETIPEDGEEDADWDWYYTDDSQFDADDEADEFSDTYLAAKDSLTLIRGHSGHAENLASLIDILRKILDALTKGVLTSEQVRALGNLAREIVAGLPGSKEVLAIHPSGSSLFAEDVVRQALVKVQNELFADVELDEKLKRDQEPLDDVRLQPESAISLLADLIGTRALCLAVEHLEYLNLMQEPGRTQVAPISTLSLQKRRQPSPTGITTYITSALQKAADEIQKELHASVTVSDTAIVLQQSLADALQHIKASARPEETILTWDEENMVPLSRDTSRTSVTSLLVKNTLTHVIRDMYRDGTLSKQLKTGSPSEVFAEGLVQIALQQCLEEVKSDYKSFDELLRLTTAIIQSHQKSQKPDHILQSKASLTVSESSIMVDKLIRDTLEIAKKAIEKGELQPMAVQGVAKGLWGPSLQHYETIIQDITKEAFGYPDDIIKSSSSRVAEKSVVDALKSVLPQTLNLYRMAKLTSSTSCLAQSSVDQAFKMAFSDMEIKDYPKAPLPTQQATSASSTSPIAEELVNRAFQELIEEYKIPGREQSKSEDFEQTDTGRLLKTHSSDLATKCVELAITDVLKDLDSSTYHFDLAQQQLPQGTNSSRELLLLLSKALDGVVSGVLRESSQDAVPTSSNPIANATDGKYEDIYEVKPDHGIHDDNYEFKDDSSDEELAIHPVFDDQELPIDHHLIENALEILSVKKDEDLGHICEPAARQSFQNMFRPNVKRVHRLDLGSTNAICKELVTLSHFDIDTKPTEADAKTKNRRWSLPPTLSHIPHACLLLPKTIDEDDDDDEEVVNVKQLHTLKPDKKEKKPFVPVAKAKSLPKYDNRHKNVPVPVIESTSIKRSKHKEVHQRKSSDTGSSISKQSSTKFLKTDSIQQTQSSTNKRSQASLQLKSNSSIRQANVVSSLPRVISKQTSNTKGRVRSESMRCDKTASLGSTHGSTSKTASRNTLDLKQSPHQSSVTQNRTAAIGTSLPNINDEKHTPGTRLSQEKDRHGKCESAGPGEKESRPTSKVPNECIKDIHMNQDMETNGSEVISTITASTEIDTSNASHTTDANDAAEIITEEEPIIQKTMRKKSYRRSSSEYVSGNKSSSSKDSLKTSSQKKSSSTTSGLVREFTSNTIHPQNNRSIASSASSEGKGRSSHQTVSLTPRPSSGYRKSPTPRSLSHIPGCSNSQLTGAKSNSSGTPVTHSQTIQPGFDSQEQTKSHDIVGDLEKPISRKSLPLDPTASDTVANSVSEKNPTEAEGSTTSLKTMDREVVLTSKRSMSSLTVTSKPTPKTSAPVTVEKSDSKITCTHSETLSVSEETTSENGRTGKPSTESLPGLSSRDSQYKVGSRRSSAITKKADKKITQVD